MRPRSRTWLTYFVVLGVFVAGLTWVLVAGAKLGPATHAPTPAEAVGEAAAPSSPGLWQALGGHLQEPLAKLLLQVILIVAFARGVGAVFGRFGQPAVIGEMLAGILLGPSLFGWILPAARPGRSRPNPSAACDC